MRSVNLPRCVRGRGALGASLWLVAQAAAQLPTPTPAPVSLSPFVLSSTDDQDWVATETLAGGRLRTDFKDLPNQIETFTKGFMDDLAVTSFDQALIYSANVENATDYAPGATGNASVKATTGGRIRSIGAGTLSRNFFPVHNPTDNFNLERATIASGPNAILFGLGSPAGILDATPALAVLRNRYGFSLQLDSEDSKRLTFDANQVLLPGRLALRVMGLTQRDYGDKKPGVSRDDRLYGSILFTPFSSTNIVLQGERARSNSSRADRYTPNDYATLWLKAAQIPGSGSAVNRPVFDNRNLANLTGSAIFAQAVDAPVLIKGGAVQLRNWRDSATVKNSAALAGADPTFDAAIETSILDAGIFPLNAGVVGTARTNRVGADTRTVIIEQRLTKTFFVELAYNSENAYEQHLEAGADLDSDLNVDPNGFIPGTVLPNPNFGKFYYQGPASTEPEFYRRDDWRVTLSKEFSFADEFGGAWARWLGRHRVSGLYTQSRSDTKTQLGFVRRILDDPVIPGLQLRSKSFQNWAIHSTRTPQFRQYFDGSFTSTEAAGPMTGDWTLTDALGKSFPLYLTETPLRAADGKRLGANFPASGSRTKVVSQIFSWQGFFLPDAQRNDRLVLTFGFRRDAARSATLDPASTAQDFSGLYPVLWDTRYSAFGKKQVGINRSYGAVVRPARGLSVFFDQSTTFDLNLGRYDPFGNELPGAAGKGRDYGLRFDLGAQASVRISRYENSLGPQRASNQINVLRDIFFNVEDRVRSLDPAIATINVTDGNHLGFRTAGRPNYFIMSDLKAEGYELEFNAAPLPGWNVRINGAISKSAESNIGRAWVAWAEQRLPVWRSVVAKNGEVDAAGRPVTWATARATTTAPTTQTLEQYYQSALAGQAFAAMEGADGRVTDNARTARVNLISNYTFREGAWRGFSVGGAVRWRAAPIVGYALRENSAGQNVLALDRPLEGNAEHYFDALVGYRRKIKFLGGLNYRFQINVRNVLADDAPVAVTRFTTGAVARIATVEPRLVIFTTDVDF